MSRWPVWNRPWTCSGTYDQICRAFWSARKAHLSLWCSFEELVLDSRFLRSCSHTQIWLVKSFFCDFSCAWAGFFNKSLGSWYLVQQTPLVVVLYLDVPGAPTVLLSGNKFLRFPPSETIRREAAPSGEQTAFLFHAFICFWVVQIFLLSEMRLSVRTHYGSSMGWIFISWNNTWQKVLSKGRKLSSELSLQITEMEISPKMDKIAISTKKQVLSVRKLRPAHFQVFWWKYSKVTSANPSVLCFVSELRGREDYVLGKR